MTFNEDFFFFFKKLKIKNFFSVQNVPPALLIRSLREHRSEWANFDIDANTAAMFRNNLHGGISASRAASAPLPFAHSLEQEEVCF
jgi:homeobox-leucine zipper protein